MFRTAIYALIYLGSFLMIYNICGFICFARRIRKLKNWGEKNFILVIPITLLILFLIGYLVVGFFGRPDIVIAGILFFGSVFVFVMYWMISHITDRILENEQIEARMLAAEETNRVKSEFLATMSHEMRTPMNVILGLTDLARKEPGLPVKTKQQLEKIDQSGRYLLGLINHVLEINEIGTGEGDLLLERFTQKAYPQKQLLGFLLCSWARPVPYHRTKGLKSIAYFGEMKRRFEARQAAVRN